MLAISHGDNHIFHLTVDSNRFIVVLLCLEWSTCPQISLSVTFLVTDWKGNQPPMAPSHIPLDTWAQVPFSVWDGF